MSPPFFKLLGRNDQQALYTSDTGKGNINAGCTPHPLLLQLREN